MNTLEQTLLERRLVEEHARATRAMHRVREPLRTELDRIAHEIRESLAIFYTTPERFGACVDCSDPIEPERLRMMPWAHRCLSCAVEWEEIPADN